MKNADPDEFHSPPFDYNYNILGLSKKRTFNKGELNRIDYYGYMDSGGTYQDLVLTEYRTFFRKSRMVYKRTMHIDWYLEDGSVGEHKTADKYYSPEESLKLGERKTFQTKSLIPSPIFLSVTALLNISMIEVFG